MNIQSRKVELYKISVPLIGRTSRTIYVTKKQLKKLNALPLGKEIFLSRFYCFLGGEFHYSAQIMGCNTCRTPFVTWATTTG